MENKHEPVIGPVTAIASITGKSENQDSMAIWENAYARVIVVTDGLGGGEYAKYAKTASLQVANFFIEQLSKLMADAETGPTAGMLQELFRGAKNDLVDFAAGITEIDGPGAGHLFGTTAIILIEVKEKIVIGYTGNGAAWHIRGNFNEFPTSFLFPWNVVNVLNPHSLPEDGKEALYRLISNGTDDDECLPSIVEIIKDRHQGDIIMICTDGIYSADQQRPGKNTKGIWIKYEPAMLIFFERLREYFQKNLYYDQTTAEFFLDKYLEEMRHELHDDATIGLLITKEAARYQYDKKPVRDEKHTSTQL